MSTQATPSLEDDGATYLIAAEEGFFDRDDIDALPQDSVGRWLLLPRADDAELPLDEEF
jgi:hypothetical protein